MTKHDVAVGSTVWMFRDDFLPFRATVVSRVGWDVAGQREDGTQHSIHDGQFAPTEGEARRLAVAAATRAADYHREKFRAAEQAVRTLRRAAADDEPGPAGGAESTGPDGAGRNPGGGR